MTLRKGVQLGTLTELHNEQTAIPDVLDNVLCDATESVDATLHPKVKELIDNYQSKLNDIPESQPANVPIEHSIELSDVTPVYEPPRRIAYSQREQISKAIDELQAEEFVEPSRSQYSSPDVPVVKHNGEIRLCCDHRKLDAKTTARQFPLPRVYELIDNMRNSSIYSVIDLKSGYFQISLKEEEEVTHETESTDDEDDDVDNEKDERAKNGEKGGMERHSARYNLRPRPRGRLPFY